MIHSWTSDVLKMTISRDRRTLVVFMIYLPSMVAFVALGRDLLPYPSAFHCLRRFHCVGNMRYKMRKMRLGEHARKFNYISQGALQPRGTEELQSGAHAMPPKEYDMKLCGSDEDPKRAGSYETGGVMNIREPRVGSRSGVGSFDNVPVKTLSGDGSYTAVLIVPTGIGAAIGGFAGDALPVARTISSVVDKLVTHPNVMNGAMLYWPESKIQYVEGFALDEFCAGRWGLLPVDKGGHRIGLVLDCAIEEELRLRHVQAADAARATLGINVAEYCLTEEPAEIALAMTGGGASWGTLKGVDSLVAAGRRLVEEAGCTALAVATRFPDDDDDEMFQAYREGQGVDALGGAEAIISHVMSQELKVPCAHSPALMPFGADASVSPRACAEELGYTFLPCVLANLHRAPSLITTRDHPKASKALWADEVDAVVAPATAFGGAGVLSLADQVNTLLVAVEENSTVMKAEAKTLLGRGSSTSRCVTVSSYLEAVGVLAAHRAGVNPACLTAQVPSIRKMPTVRSPTSGEGGDDSLDIVAQSPSERETHCTASHGR